MTIKQIAEKLGVDQTTANGLVSFLRAKGLMIKVGDTRTPGAKGKPSALYALKAYAASQVKEMLIDLKISMDEPAPVELPGEDAETLAVLSQPVA